MDTCTGSGDPQAPEAEGMTQEVHQTVGAAAETIAGSRVAVEILEVVGPAVTGNKSTGDARFGY
jgi:hypothetical protein